MHSARNKKLTAEWSIEERSSFNVSEKIHQKGQRIKRFVPLIPVHACR